MTKKEIEFLKKYGGRRISISKEKDAEYIRNLVDKAIAYEREIGLEYVPDDLLLWYYDQYKAQQKQKGVLPTREK
ncbi:MAG: hypothetical protein IKP63_03765 [Paludibacteraceae bacterium]|nr:hypothetical protein [Paludibacteraceae bacterium]MBR6287408.1 hypothetical protein [Bacteroidaceae bacterium]